MRPDLRDQGSLFQAHVEHDYTQAEIACTLGLQYSTVSRLIQGGRSGAVAKLLAYAGDVRRFAHTKALAAFIGVTPRQRLSGSSVKGRTMMSRTGHADLRRALYMRRAWSPGSTIRCSKYSGIVSVTGLAPKAVVGTVMRKLAHLIYGVIKSGRPFDATAAMPRVAFQDGI